MKHIFSLLLAIICILAVGQASAQLDVRLHPIRSNYLLGESIAVKLSITNHSDELVVLDNAPDHPWLHFTVMPSGSSQPMAPKMIPVFEKIHINPGSKHETVINLRPYFYFSHVGSFKVIASVRMSDMRSTYSSNRATFSVSNGGSVKTFATQRDGKRLKMHVKMMRTGDKDSLFGQVENADSGVVIGACQLGLYLNFMNPRILIDKKQNLHVLCQSTTTYFTYAVMTPDGTRSHYQVMSRTGGPVDLITTGNGIKAIGLTPAKQPGKDPADNYHTTSDR